MKTIIEILVIAASVILVICGSWVTIEKGFHPTRGEIMIRRAITAAIIMAGIAFLLTLLTLPAKAQDTPTWWPEPMPADSATDGRTLIFDRPLANYNDPTTGRPMCIVAVRDVCTGAFWRVLARHEEANGAQAGDTLTVTVELP